MLKINSPLFVNIEIVLVGSFKEVSLLQNDLMRYALNYNYLTASKYEYQNYKMSFDFLLSNINKVNKIIEKHTHYFSDIKKYKTTKES